MTPKKHTHKKPIQKILCDNHGNKIGESYRGRITVAKDEPEFIEVPKKSIRSPIPVKRGPCKSVAVHMNGKTRPIRDDKGHFAGSESIDLDKECTIPDKVARSSPRIDRTEIEFKTVHNDITGKDYTVGVPTREINLPVKSPYTRNDYLKLFRVYTGNGNSYRYEFSQKNLQDEPRTDLVMTMYEPKIDLIALERAIRKYRMDSE